MGFSCRIMRIRLKKTLTWGISAFCFILLTFNYYNRSVWLPTDKAHPVGRNVDSLPEQDKSREPNVGKAERKAVPNVTTERVRIAEQIRKSADTSGLTNKTVLWPDTNFYENDRITNQLNYKTKRMSEQQLKGEEVTLKKILLYTGIGGWAVQRGRKTFQDQKCGIDTCEITDNRNEADTADAILFSHSPQRSWTSRPAHQIWALFLLESPYHTPGLGAYSNVFNWTATYRHDSDIVAPYEKFVPFDENVQTMSQNKSYAAGKTKKVAWFVSNCGARNTRKEYALELSKHIDVDIYGACGPLRCSRRDSKCFNMLNSDYKFYLSFENSNCRDYITEKFFVTGLQ